jgi:hypothetical protein
MAEAIGERVESFRSSIAGLKPFILLMSGIIGMSSGSGVIAKSDFAIGKILLGLVIIPVAAGAAYGLMALLLGLACRAYPVHVHRGGLRSYNAMGAYTSMTWSEMSAVKDVHYVGLEYYEITSSRSGRKILVPRFLEDPAGFRARIAGFVSFNHVLLKALGR